MPPRLQSLSLPQITLEQGLWATLLVLGFAIRFWDVGARAMHGDESVHAWLAWNLFTGVGYRYDPVYHGPLQFLVTTGLFFLFGVSNATARLMAVLFGSALVLTPFLLRAWMGRAAALVAGAFIAFSPAFVYVSRLERDDIFTSFFAMILAVAIWRFVATRRAGYFYLGAAAAALSLTAMENTYITLFVFATFLLVVMISERMAGGTRGDALLRFWQRRAMDVAWAFGGLLLTAFALTVITGLYLPVPFMLGIGIVLLVHQQTVLATAREGEARFTRSFGALSRQNWLNAATIVIAILFLAFSTFGSNLQGIWDSAQPFFNTKGACANNPFPLNPCRKDIIGGLFYWLSQHEVHRGGQPWFYYSLLFGLYEQIAVVFGVGAMLWFLRRPTLFTAFLTYWAILMFGVYSWAGEKFSWLMIHPLLPFLLLAAMLVVDLLRAGGLVRWIALLALALLALLELHSAYEVNFVNGADPVEMMVYVQSSPDTPKVANNVLDISQKVTQGDGLHATVDSEDAWPFAWYLRDLHNAGYPDYPQLTNPPFSTNPVIIVGEDHQAALAPKLGSKYLGHRYRLRWWFPEDYKLLSWSSFGQKLVNPGYWNVVWQWLANRRPFGPKGAIWFYYYVKRGLVSPF